MAHGILDKQLPNSLLGLKGQQPPAHPSSNPLSQLHAQGSNPTAMDPVQQQIFNFMPWILMFVMAPFAAGLLLYWVTSNILTLAQQSYLYSKHPQLRAATEKQKADSEKNSLKKGY